MRTFALTLSVILLCAGLLSAQNNRQFPRTDLNAVPGTGQSEILLRSTIAPSVNLWYQIFIDGTQVALVEPGIPEKIIVQNGFNKLLVQPGNVNNRNGRIQNAYRLNAREVVIEANSSSITVEISRKGIEVVPIIEITETRPLGNVPQAASPAPSAPQEMARAVANMGTAVGLEGALERAADQVSRNVPQRSKIAIVYITAQDGNVATYIAGELEFIWVNGGFTLIDRSQLDRLRREQDLQMSGEIDDETAVSIGKFAGADIIVTGTVDGEGNLRRLRLRALNTQTAQVVGAASERF